MVAVSLKIKKTITIITLSIVSGTQTKHGNHGDFRLIFGEDTGGQTIFDVVRFFYCLFQRFHLAHSEERQEEFALEQLVVQRQPIDDGRRDKRTFSQITIRQAFTTSADCATGPAATTDPAGPAEPDAPVPSLAAPVRASRIASATGW